MFQFSLFSILPCGHCRKVSIVFCQNADAAVYFKTMNKTAWFIFDGGTYESAWSLFKTLQKLTSHSVHVEELLRFSEYNFNFLHQCYQLRYYNNQSIISVKYLLDWQRVFLAASSCFPVIISLHSGHTFLCTFFGDIPSNVNEILSSEIDIVSRQKC